MGQVGNWENGSILQRDRQTDRYLDIVHQSQTIFEAEQTESERKTDRGNSTSILTTREASQRKRVMYVL